MGEAAILRLLCWYDPRHPDYEYFDCIGPDPDGIPPPRVDCRCDNCFYGRDALALEILRLREIEKAARAYMSANVQDVLTLNRTGRALRAALNPKEA